VNIADETPGMVADFRRALRRAGSQLGVKIHVQRQDDDLVFWAEEAT
jgi:predicted amino acid-binding ACT domain protein